jgi:hypothetical protein
MSVVFAISTVATYVVMCVFSAARLQRLSLGAFERWGGLSGAFISLVLKENRPNRTVLLKL